MHVLVLFLTNILCQAQQSPKTLAGLAFICKSKPGTKIDLIRGFMFVQFRKLGLEH